MGKLYEEERAKAILRHIELFESQGLEVPKFLTGLAKGIQKQEQPARRGRPPKSEAEPPPAPTPAPAPEPTPAPAPVPEAKPEPQPEPPPAPAAEVKASAQGAKPTAAKK